MIPVMGNKPSQVGPQRLGELLRVGPGFALSELSPRATPGFAGSKQDGAQALAEGRDRVTVLQERLWAASRGGDTRRLLLVVQGMDTSGKGGIMRHVVGAVDPQGVQHTAFKAPTAEERGTTSCGGSARRCRRPGRSGSSTAPTTRTC